jgi:hypothetical protein
MRTALYVVTFSFCATVSLLMMSFVPWLAKAASCDPRWREPGLFLAYCSNPNFADYEHGAYYLGLEAEAVANARTADVLFLGNSKLQYAFSTDVTRRYFAQRAIPYYLLGFGYTERSPFAISLVEKLAIKPEVIVVNADPFFWTDISEPAKAVMGGSAFTMSEYVKRYALNRVHDTTCSLFGELCRPVSGAIYREAATGAWILKGEFDPFAAAPIYGPPETTLQIGLAPAIEEAQRLIGVTGIEPGCVVLTDTPNQHADATDFVQALAAEMGFTVILPNVLNIATVDGGHMHGTSARRWSAAFLSELSPVLDRCLAGHSQYPSTRT